MGIMPWKQVGNAFPAGSANNDNADRASFKYEVPNLGKAIRAIRTQAYFTQVIHFMSDDQRTSARNGTWTMASEASTRAIGGHVEADLRGGLTIGAEGFYRNWNVVGYMRMMGTVGPGNHSVPNVDTNAVGAFAAYQHPFSDRLRWSGGLRWDYSSTATSAANVNTNPYFNYHGTRATSSNDNYFSGNARLSYTLPLAIELFAGVGSNGRVPDAEERYINRASMTTVNVGNPALPTVRNTEGTVGLIFRRRSSYVKPTFFYSNLNNYVLVNNQPLMNTMAMSPASARSYTNVDARIYGGELSYALNLRSGLSLTGGGSYAKGGNNRNSSAGVLDSNLPEMPPLRTWAILHYVHKYLFAEFGGSAVARQNRVDRDLKETPTAGYGLMNLKLGLTHGKLVASFMVENLLNRYYFEHLSYYRDPFSSGVKIPEPGRNFFGQVRYNF